MSAERDHVRVPRKPASRHQKSCRGEPLIPVSDGEPLDGNLIAVVDESSPAAGAGVYYVLTTAVVFSASVVQERVADVIGERAKPFHYRREGIEAIERMVSVLEEIDVMASVLWRSVGRRGQVAARREMLATHARRIASDGVTHLIIESGDTISNQRDKATLLDTFADSGGVPYRYDWRSKAEPLMWVADAICGVATEHLLSNPSKHFNRLAKAGVIEVENG